MAKNVQPPKATAGGGYAFEDYVVAYLFCKMLTNSIVFEPEAGTISCIEFQTRVQDWYLDDVLLTLVIAGTERECAISMKSAKQITENGFSTDFVSSVWEQYLVGGPFVKERDLLCLITSPLAEGVSSAVSTLLQWSRAQKPGTLERSVRTRRATNKKVRTLFESWVCPQDLVAKFNPIADDRIAVLRHVRVLGCDFEADPSLNLGEAINLCRGILRSDDLKEARKLWDSLCGIAKYYRPRRGFLTIGNLVDKLRLQFRLKNFPAHEEDWGKLGRHTEMNLQQIRDTIGNRVSLDRSIDLKKLQEVVKPRHIMLLSGPSGCGKTVLVKNFVQSKLDFATVVWWNASRLNELDYGLFENKFGLANPLGEIIGKVTAQEAYLVLDGLDRYVHERVFANLGTVIRFLDFESENCPWRVIIPTQDEEAERIYRGLWGAEIPVERIVRVPTSQPPVEQLAPVWAAFPSLARLANRHELRRLLLKPKILDLFASHIATEEPDPAQWTGESDLIEWFWDTVVKSGPSSHVRDGFLKQLAEYQADQCDAQVPAKKFGISDRAPVESLIQDRICRDIKEQYTFEHELYGDWARQRILLGERGDLSGSLKEKVNSPLWHRGIRLLGVHILEQESVESWRRTYEEISSDRGNLSGDLILESVIFAANPCPLLENMWDVLISNNGLLLKRLLGRFLHVATSPNALVVGISRLLEFGAISGPATWERIPIAAYWPPVIEFLHHHKAEAIEIAPLQVAKVCERWLAAGPLDGPSRTKAAELALDMAEDRVALKIAFWRGVHNEDLDRIVFKAAFESFDAAPERTRELLLIACGRSQPSGRIRETAENFLANAGEESCVRSYAEHWIELPQHPHVMNDIAEYGFPDAWPDGPIRIVDDTFAETCLTTNALTRLMLNDPTLVTEIILACLIPSPSQIAYSYYYATAGKLGLTGADDQLRPPFWNRGPFFPFLMINPSAGLNLIIRLVDFVTDRWAENEGMQSARPATVFLHLEQGCQQFVGDSSVFSWHRGFGSAPNAVETALMALEKWLYYQLDEGRSVFDAITQILTKARSIAFLGLLCCVGKRNPELLEGELRPLLGVPESYDWDLLQVAQGNSMAMLAWGLSAPHLQRLAHQWYNLPHRNWELRQVAFKLFVESEQLRTFFEEVRSRWAARVAEERESGNGSRFIESLINLFDPANLATWKDTSGNVYIYSRCEEKHTGDDDAFVKNLQIRTLLGAWPHRLWKLLIGEETLPEEEVEGFWNKLSGVSEICLPQDLYALTFKTENCLAGGAAVLLKHHRQWLNDHSETEAWCIATILGLVLKPPEPSPMDSDSAYQEGRWRGFCAAILPTLLLEQPDSAERRRAVACVATDPHYDAVRILFESAAALRVQLADDLKRLQNLVLAWAAARWVRMRANVLEAAAPDIEAWRHREIEQFVKGETPTGAPDWQIIRESVSRDLPMDDGRARAEFGLRTPGIDVQMIMNAYSWLADLDGALSEDERQERICFLEQALRCSLEVFSELLEAAGHKPFARHYKWIQWLFDRLVRAIPSMLDDEHPDRFWQPVLQFGADGHKWIDLFFSSWFMAYLAGQRIPERFVTEWCRMIDFVMQSDRWSFEQVGFSYHDLSGIWCNVMGFGAHWVGLWTAHHGSTVDRMRDRYETWAAVHLGRSRCAQGFAEFLQQPAAQGLRAIAVVWFARAADEVGNRYFSDSEVESSIASLLDLCWTRQASEIRRNKEVFEAYKRLLRLLADRQNATAMEILQRMASGI